MAHPHYIVDDDNRFIIDPETRELSNVSGDRPSLMQYDHNSERFTFEMPRNIEGHDMSTCDLLEVYYTNTSSGTSKSSRTVVPGLDVIHDLAIDPEDDTKLTFSWLIGRDATQQAGTLTFQFKFSCREENVAGQGAYVWHTGVYSMVDIRSSLNVSGEISEAYPDILSQLTLETKILLKKTDDLEARMEDLVYIGDGDMPDDCVIQIIPDDDDTVVDPDDPDIPGVDDTVYHTVTIHNAENVDVSNDATRVEEGSSYSVTLTPHDGFTIESVTCTHGGETVLPHYTPVDSTARVIDVSRVTGDIVITVVATATGTGGGTTPVTYNVTRTLSNVTINNEQETITENAAYSATISANLGYEIGTYTLTIGGISHDNYITVSGDLKTAAIYIPSNVVDGDVEITVLGSAVSSGDDDTTTYWVNCTLGEGLTATKTFPLKLSDGDPLYFEINADDGYQIGDIVTMESDGVDFRGCYSGDEKHGVIDYPGIIGTTIIVIESKKVEEDTGGDDTGDDTGGDDNTYTITYNFDEDEVWVSNAPQDKTLGGELDLRLEPATGRKITSLSATMGGVEVKDDLDAGTSVWFDSDTGTDGMVYIASVTGDIVVTATTIEADT